MRSVSADGVVMQRGIIVVLFLTSMAASDHTTRAATNAPPLRLVQTIPPPGVEGRMAKVPTTAGARTGLFSADLRRLFVAVPRRANPTAEIRVFDVGP
jgi:hypothetical protein